MPAYRSVQMTMFPMPLGGRRAGVIAAAVLVCVAMTADSAARQRATEHEIKGELVSRLVDFVTWPEGASANNSDPFVVGVLGESPIVAALDDALRGRSTRGRSFAIRTYSRLEGLQLGSAPGILFVSASESDHYRSVVLAVEGLSVLTVGEETAFVLAGGMLDIRIVNGSPRIEIALARATALGFRFDSRLLEISEIFASHAASGGG